MKNDIKEVLLTKEQIHETVVRLGGELTRDYAGKNPLMISVLKGAFVFMADLARAVDIPMTMDFMAVSSYGAGTQSTGQVKIIKDLDTNIEGKHVIVVEDILDSGVTLFHLLKLLGDRNPASIKVCTLLDKPERHKVDVKVDYTGLVVPDEFVVGYGLDYAEKYRNLPEICVLKPEVYTK